MWFYATTTEGLLQTATADAKAQAWTTETSVDNAVVIFERNTRKVTSRDTACKKVSAYPNFPI
jgi:hypothetical protein